VERRVVYEGSQFDVVVEQWGDREREFVAHPGSVGVLAVREGCVTLVRQLREPARRHLLELPAGSLDGDGESPLEAAKRELREETGFHGGRWRKLAGFFPTPGICSEYTEVYLAEDVEEGEAEPEEGEEIELVHWPIAEIPQRLGELEDATTLAALLLFLRLDPSDPAG
jgi:ADP-ribose pyrophosphatase